ncbi:hypothetical protein EV363DRAFT_1301106 [Boletus edulis]|nr:hypothetical protein EV363DRAFT_1301106 [Boletus edulis]
MYRLRRFTLSSLCQAVRITRIKTDAPATHAARKARILGNVAQRMEGTETFSICYNLLRYDHSFNFTEWFINHSMASILPGSLPPLPAQPPGADKIAGGTRTRTEDTCMYNIHGPHKGRLTLTRYPPEP